MSENETPTTGEELQVDSQNHSSQGANGQRNRSHRRNGRSQRDLGVDTKLSHTQKLPQVIDLTNLKPKKVSYLWEPYLPNKFCLLDGRPDTGKSQYYLYLSTRITCGLPFFTEDVELRREPGNVVIVQAEDDVEDTLLPRLHGAGADLSRVILLRRTWNMEDADGETKREKITFDNLEALHAVAEQYRPQLIVMDPFNSFVAGRGTNTSHSMRPMMENLIDLAGTHQCCVLVVRHISKRHRGTALDAGAGSHDIVASSRSMLLTAHDPQIPGQFVLAHAKSNLSARGDSLTYRLVNIEEWDAPRLEFTGYSYLTADDLSNPKRSDNNGVQDAVVFLQALLAEKPRPSAEVKRVAQRHGFSRRVLDEAKKKVGIQTKGVYEKGRRGAQEHVWSLPSSE